MNRYAPANDAGEKPYVVELSDWGKTRLRLVYAKDAADARHRGKGRGHVGLYVTKVRRATPDDLKQELEP